MFEWLTIDTLVEASKPFMTWILEQQAYYESEARRMLWAGPWWMKLLLVVGTVGPAFEWLRRNLSPSRPRQRGR